jgi:hypothetical protein
MNGGDISGEMVAKMCNIMVERLMAERNATICRDLQDLERLCTKMDFRHKACERLRNNATEVLN